MVKETEAKTAKLVIEARDNKVVFEFRDNRFIFTPPNAVALAESLINAAQACGFVIEIQQQRKPLTPMQYAVLVARTRNIMKSLGGKRKLEHIAQEVVDSILSERE